MIQFKKYTSEKQLIKQLPRVCKFCKTTDENNFDPDDGKLYSLELAYRDKNFRNQKLNNLLLICRRHKKLFKHVFLFSETLPYKFFKPTGRI